MAQSPLLEKTRKALGAKHYTIQNEITYVLGLKRFILVNQQRHVTLSKQNLTLCAIFLYKSMGLSNSEECHQTPK